MSVCQIRNSGIRLLASSSTPSTIRISAEDVAAHREALPSAEIHVWPGAGHGFNCDQRADYQPEAAQQAMQRTLGFLQKNLRG